MDYGGLMSIDCLCTRCYSKQTPLHGRGCGRANVELWSSACQYLLWPFVLLFHYSWGHGCSCKGIFYSVFYDLFMLNIYIYKCHCIQVIIRLIHHIIWLINSFCYKLIKGPKKQMKVVKIWLVCRYLFEALYLHVCMYTHMCQLICAVNNGKCKLWVANIFIYAIVWRFIYVGYKIFLWLITDGVKEH